MEYMVSEKADIVAFVQQGDLWSYAPGDGKVNRVFSFRKSENGDFRDSRNQHDIKIIRVNEDGDIDFVLYGYMNRGAHEGYEGIGVYHYNNDKNKVYISSILDKTHNLYIKIMRENCNWIDEIYRLSLKYGLSAIDLANPYDMKDVIEKDLIFHEEEAIRTRSTNKFPFPIPTFLNDDQNSFVFFRKTKGDNLYFDVKLTDSNFNIEDTLNFIADQICVYMLINNKNLSKNVKYRLNNIVERDNEPEKYSNSIRTRILGLAQWDHRIKYLSEEYNNIREFKRFLFNSPKYCSYCDRTPGTSGCPCPSPACAAALTRQLYSAVSSIESGRVTDIKNVAKQVPKNAKMIFDRISIPYDEMPHLQRFFSKL